MKKMPFDKAKLKDAKVYLARETKKTHLPASLIKSLPVIEGDESGGNKVSAPDRIKTGRRPPLLLLSFITLVIFPSLAAFAYFTIFASDQYIAEARFAVRSLADEASDSASDMGLLRMHAASQDAHVVTSFIHSTEILLRLKGKVDYRSMFTDGQADFLSRFSTTGSQEEFLQYWSARVSAYIDGPSGIVTLSARTFKPEDSVELLSVILHESEVLVNEMTQRAREDLIGSFSQEVKRTEELYRLALLNLNQFQQESSLLNPEILAQEKGKLLTGLLARKMELESRLFVMQESNSVDTPAYTQMQLTRESIDNQIEGLRSEMTGLSDASLANVINRYSEVETDRLLAEKLYEGARNAHERAVTAAMRKALYLTVFVQPSLPEESLYPKRLSSPLMVFLILMASWTTLALIWASVEDHRL